MAEPGGGVSGGDAVADCGGGAAGVVRRGSGVIERLMETMLQRGRG